MAATTNTTAVPVPGSNTDKEDATDLITSMATAVGPLVILFGELATKQFLSLSMGWKDDVLLAVGPIGIITVAVSTIRISGFRWLKAIIGRARESRSDAEQEFLSSTSPSVCELWSGREIVRLNDAMIDGSTGNLFVVRLQEDYTGYRPSESSAPTILNPEQALENKLLVPLAESKRWLLSAPPNVTLNIEGITIGTWELRFWCLLGLALQTLVLVLPAVSTYHFRWTRKGRSVPSFSYGIFASGTVINFIGMFMCGRIIETSTTEAELTPRIKPEDTDGLQASDVLQLQKSRLAGSQSFPSCLFVPETRPPRLRLSGIASRDSRLMASCASLAAILGFILQLIGLSALHWSATVVVLATSLCMASVRAWIRRGLAQNPVWIPIPDGKELPWLVHRVVHRDWTQLHNHFVDGNHHQDLECVPLWTGTLQSRDATDPLRFPEMRHWDDVWGPLVGTTVLDPEDLINRPGRHWYSVNDPSRLSEHRSDLSMFFFRTSYSERQRQRRSALVSRRKEKFLADQDRHTSKLQFYGNKAVVLGFVGLDPKLDQCIEITTGISAINAMPSLRNRTFNPIGNRVWDLIVNLKNALAHTIPWAEDRPPWEDRVWRVDIRSGSKIVPISIPSPGNMMKCAEAEAALGLWLSMWIYTLESSRAYMDEEDNQVYYVKRVQLWGTDRTAAGPKFGHVRIMGTCPGTAVDLLESWMPGSRLYTRHNPGASRLVIGAHLIEGTGPSYLWRKPLYLFGMLNSSTFSWEREDSYSTFCYEPDKIRADLEKDVICFSHDGNLINLCVQEIVNLFLLSVCMNLKRHNGKLIDRRLDVAIVEAVPTISNNETPATPTAGYVNAIVNLVDALAQAVTQSGFAATENDAMACVLPAFARYQLLEKRT